MTEEAPPQIVSQTFEPEVSMRRLKEHPNNPRRGRDDVVGESIDTHGFYGALLVHKATRHIIGGNTRFRALRARGVKKVDVFWITCDEATATRILIADNRTSDVATYDSHDLAHLLAAMDSTVGTGYSDDDIAHLLALTTVDTVEPTENSDGVNDRDFWPTLSVRLEPSVYAAWGSFVHTHSSPAAAFAALMTAATGVSFDAVDDDVDAALASLS